MHGCDEDMPTTITINPARPAPRAAPKWIHDANEAANARCYAYASSESLAHELLDRIPQTALLTLADTACHRAQLEGSDARACAADLVTSMLEVLAAGDTESGALVAEHAKAWALLSESGAPMGDEGRVFTLTDRIRWLVDSRSDAWHERDRAEDRATDLELGDINTVRAERDRVGVELAAAIKENRHRREENQRLVARVADLEQHAHNLIEVGKAQLVHSSSKCTCGVDAGTHTAQCDRSIALVDLERVLDRVGA